MQFSKIIYLFDCVNVNFYFYFFFFWIFSVFSLFLLSAFLVCLSLFLLFDISAVAIVFVIFLFGFFYYYVDSFCLFLLCFFFTVWFFFLFPPFFLFGYFKKMASTCHPIIYFSFQFHGFSQIYSNSRFYPSSFRKCRLRLTYFPFFIPFIINIESLCT